MRLLLDTCTFLWLALDDPQISPVARAAYLDEDNDVFLSAASSWEIAVKFAAGRLTLPDIPRLFLPNARAALGIGSLELTEGAAVFAASLPSIHKDPFDRILVCQALAGGLTILTPDPLIARYPVSTLW